MSFWCCVQLKFYFVLVSCWCCITRMLMLFDFVVWSRETRFGWALPFEMFVQCFLGWSFLFSRVVFWIVFWTIANIACRLSGKSRFVCKINSQEPLFLILEIIFRTITFFSRSIRKNLDVWSWKQSLSWFPNTFLKILILQNDSRSNG